MTPSAESPRLLGAGEQADRLAAGLRRGRQKGRAVGGIACRRRGEHEDVGHVHGLAEHAEPGERTQGAVNRVVVEAPGRRHMAAEAAEDLLVVDRRRRRG